MTTSSFDYDVAIVGYGPTGVSAANFLGAYGIRCVVMERDREIYPRARAVTVNDWTLRCYQSVGLADELLKVMDPMTEMRWRTYAGKDLMRMKVPDPEMGLPVASMIYQPAMEQVLRAGVERFASRVEVRFGQEVTLLRSVGAGSEVSFRDVDTGVQRCLTARYVLACDGGSSNVRTQLGIPLEGSTTDTKWVVIDVRVKRWWPERHLLTFWSDAKRPVVDIPLALGNHRWEFPLAEHESEKDFSTHDQLWTLLATMGVTPENIEIHQHAFYKHHVRRAQRWRSGSVFLLGDAAHLMPPWAGSGMQSGIRDAFNLCWKIREVLGGRLPESILDSYEAERAPNVAFVTAESERLGRIIKRQMTAAEKFDAVHRLIRKALHMRDLPQPLAGLPALDAGWMSAVPTKTNLVGKMPPQPRVADVRGRQGRLDDFLGMGFVLVGDGVDPAELLSGSQQAAWAALNSRYIALREGSQGATSENELIDLDGSFLDWMRARNTKCVALRPDRFVVAADDALNVPVLPPASMEARYPARSSVSMPAAVSSSPDRA
ncbi:bifunctional 3-(3-hydroxy-phenyl)propionate/3-hydroxycinnamic acid hydroxylase [Paraburkholderia sp. J63]|uniref:bifunctional 3-(3-hydroxy-phenyl)propionate/3-hydroxycinnamic acid hydroxylase n=1 Tax=Paraburkholderia sp. J63 TaxID=2805434 RepID=UPI002ABE62C4|nr:bifunctional 3-(3-hydroxy-phenyl)propionate/3-hydroxycinnamic acid hydroxylase [Paraburkholderia sp. J63]